MQHRELLIMSMKGIIKKNKEGVEMSFVDYLQLMARQMFYGPNLSNINNNTVAVNHSNGKIYVTGTSTNLPNGIYKIHLALLKRC